MQNEKIFRTKTGYCHILPDKIVLTRDGVIDNIPEFKSGNRIWKHLLFYLAIAVFLLISAVKGLQNGHIIPSILLIIGALFLIISVLLSLNNSAVPVIERNQIKEVKFKKSLKGITRARFEVFFEDENNYLKKRLILLPGAMFDGDNAAKEALDIMQEENLI